MRDFQDASADLAYAAGEMLKAGPLEMSEAARLLSDCLAVWQALAAEEWARQQRAKQRAPLWRRRSLPVWRVMAALRARLASLHRPAE